MCAWEFFLILRASRVCSVLSWYSVKYLLCSAREAVKNGTAVQLYSACRDLPCHRHGKLFISRPCKKRADDLLKLSRHHLKIVLAIFTGHAPVRGHLYIMGLFDGDPTCRFCMMETQTVQYIICCCEALARQRYNVFGKLTAEPRDTITASVENFATSYEA